MNADHQPLCLGIDLGTTMSAACVMLDGELVFIRNGLGETLTPSVVAHDARSGGLLVGRTAKDILAVNPDQAASLFKRRMGSEDPVQVGPRALSPVDLSAYVLDALRSDAERQLGRVVDRCVVTVPAYFNEPQRQATQRAAQVAGFQVERILNEPTAAAMAYGLHEQDAEESEFVVLDLGGGTFDVCVMERFEGLLEVKSVAGISQLGGEDFTFALRDLALRIAGVDSACLDQRMQAMLVRRCELLKRKLSRWPHAEVNVPTGEGEREVTVQVSAADADGAFRPLLDRMVAPCRSALRGAGLSANDLSAVVLVGGATRMPCIAALCEELFEVPVRVQDDPDHLVAKGAAIQAALCTQDAAVDDLVVTDVASHTLGIETSPLVLGRRVEGHFFPIIERNTVIPTSRSERFSTVKPNQSSIEVEVFEGESRKVQDNRRLGAIEVKGIAPGLPREVIEVRFTYDMNGLLEVEVTAIETGKKQSKVFQRGDAQLSGGQLEDAVERLQRLKADPLERPRYRDIVARANALWGEVRGETRANLGAAVEALEVALTERDAVVSERAYDTLRCLCDDIDHGERW